MRRFSSAMKRQPNSASPTIAVTPSASRSRWYFTMRAAVLEPVVVERSWSASVAASSSDVRDSIACRTCIDTRVRLSSMAATRSSCGTRISAVRPAAPDMPLSFSQEQPAVLASASNDTATTACTRPDRPKQRAVDTQQVCCRGAGRRARPATAVVPQTRQGFADLKRAWTRSFAPTGARNVACPKRRLVWPGATQPRCRTRRRASKASSPNSSRL